MMTALGVARVIKPKSQMSLRTFLFTRRSLLSVALFSAIVAPAYALEALSDASMSDTAGEGIAFYAENFQFQMPSVAGDVTQTTIPTINQTSGSNLFGTGTAAYGLGAAQYYPGNYGSYIYIGPLGSVPAAFSVTANNVTYSTSAYAVAGASGSQVATPTGGTSGTGMGAVPIVSGDGTVTNGSYAATTGNTYTIYNTALSSYANLKAETSKDNVTQATTTFTPNRTDVFIYGLSLSQSNTTAVTTSAGSACTQTAFNSAGVVTTAGAGCIGAGSVVAPANGLNGTTARGTLFNSGGISSWGTAMNPFTLSVGTTPSSSATNPGLAGEAVAIPYLQFAAPTNNMVQTDASNNLKLGFWANILQEDMTSPAFGQSGNNTLNKVGTAGPALQLQALWDGFGINGTVVNIFPTDPCSSGCNSSAPGTLGSGNSAYANVLGFAGVVRLNSQPTGVLRLSVAGASGLAATSANFGQFDPYEGIYLQNLDINLPLGNIGYQPLILSSSATTSGTNLNCATGALCPTISLELAQIPNIAAVYNQFYINYDPKCTISGITCTSAAGNAYGNGSGAVGLTPQAGMCSSGYTTASCPTSATHGNISLGNVYTNTTGATQYNYVTYMLDSTTQVSYSTGTACPSGDTCYSAVPAAICPKGITCSGAIVTNVSAGTVPTDPTTSTNAGGNGTYNVLYPGASDATYINNAGAIATASTSNVNGTAFKLPGASGAAVNLGNAAISGLMINHLKMTLTGL